MRFLELGSQLKLNGIVLVERTFIAHLVTINVLII